MSDFNELLHALHLKKSDAARLFRVDRHTVSRWKDKTPESVMLYLRLRLALHELAAQGTSHELPSRTP